MKFGTYTEIQSPDNGDHHRLIFDTIDLCLHSERLGYEIFSTVEHPFYENFSVCADPVSLFAYLAAKTTKMKFRTLCHTLPFHNPVVLAGSIAQLDVLTEGRLECGIGRGHAWTNKPAGINVFENQEMYDECLDIMLKAWTTEGHFDYEGKHYQIENARLVPKCYQDPHPNLVQVGTSTRQFQRGGENGWIANMGGPAPVEAFKPALDVYRKACADNGHTPTVGWVRPVFIDENLDRAMEDAQEYVYNFIRYNFSPIYNVDRDTEEKREKLRAAGYHFYADAKFLGLLDLSAEELIENKLVHVGTPKKVGDEILDIYEQVKFDEILIISHYADMPLDLAIRNQELFARDIMPRLKEAAGDPR